jgi:hypothetical protein
LRSTDFQRLSDSAGPPSLLTADDLLRDHRTQPAADRSRGAGTAHDYFLPYLLPLARQKRLIFVAEGRPGRSEKLDDPVGCALENMVEDAKV